EHLLICEFTNLQKINKKEKSYQLQLHSEAAVPEKPYHDLPTYEMIGTLGILGRVYKYKQVYCYQVGIPYKDQNRYLENVPEKFTLHLRFTFFCLEKLFKKNQHLLDVVVKSA
ncbi:hypothetical protein GWN26_02075, partial [Candidatus Saccharibacteria bacterium]|nr:hypothetical protein [Calditrichia bacterium]NIV71448.1 hypothetical protein [Calditrichia bacterium]NIV97989.1 hypothetical protein [Candidatus Saccharibacteria bacterium]NIW78467.1 hypothetical protein [Calditrichia bacterium]